MAFGLSWATHMGSMYSMSAGVGHVCNYSHGFVPTVRVKATVFNTSIIFAFLSVSILADPTHY